MLIIVFVAGVAFGFGAAAILHLLFGLAADHLSGGALTDKALEVLSWFVGNGAAVAMIYQDFDRQTGVPGAKAMAMLAYLTGFGLTAGIMTLRRETTPIRLLREILGNREIEVLILVLRYQFTVEEVASRLGMPVGEVHDLYKEALKTLSRCGEQYFRRRRRQRQATGSPRPPATPAGAHDAGGTAHHTPSGSAVATAGAGGAGPQGLQSPADL